MTTTADIDRIEDALMLLRERYRTREEELQLLGHEVMRLQVQVRQARATLSRPDMRGQ